MKKQAIGIIRVSTAIQDMERQRRDVAQAARVHDLEILRTLELPDLSGTKMLQHPEVQQVLNSLASPGVDGCVVSAVDRLIRPGELGDLGIFDSFQRSKKLIWTPGQVLDVSTQSGFLMGGIQGIMAGIERMLIIQRTTAGKETTRLRGGAPNGPITFPRGLSYSKRTWDGEKWVDARWSYEEPDCSRVRRAYDLLFERWSWKKIAAEIGGGWTYNGVRETLQNPCWKGIRRYTEGRVEPLEVPMPGISEPLISPERWEAAQQLIREKGDRWKARRQPPSFLLAGLITCGRCGKPYYLRCNGRGRGFYYCSSQFPRRGPSCGQRSEQKVAAELAVTEIVTSQLVSIEFLRAVFEQLQKARPGNVVDSEKLAKVNELEIERQRLLHHFVKGRFSEADVDREKKRIDAELRNLGKLTAAPAPPAFDPEQLATGIIRALSQFGKMPFENQRAILRDVCREITVLDGAISGFTLSGAFLNSVKKAQPSCMRSTRRKRYRFSSAWRRECGPGTTRKPRRW
jgi:DNA invertase Pin-like site-specific DNA recombinase